MPVLLKLFERDDSWGGEAPPKETQRPAPGCKTDLVAWLHLIILQAFPQERINRASVELHIVGRGSGSTFAILVTARRRFGPLRRNNACARGVGAVKPNTETNHQEQDDQPTDQI